MSIYYFFHKLKSHSCLLHMLDFPPSKPAFPCLFARHSMPLASLPVFQSTQVPGLKCSLQNVNLGSRLTSGRLQHFWLQEAEWARRIGSLSLPSSNSNAETLEIPQVPRSPFCHGWTVRMGWVTPGTHHLVITAFSRALYPIAAENFNWQECEITAKFHWQGKLFSFNKKGRKPRIINSQEIQHAVLYQNKCPRQNTHSRCKSNPNIYRKQMESGWGELKKYFQKH